ncbi:MAG: zinc ribbon domain-containing protein, partial [Pyrinomonadaceae bacterium]
MQQTSLCTTCGAEVPGEARFCRNCGQRSSHLNPESVTEGTTRLLETPERPSPFNQHVYEHPGHLAHGTSRIHPQANPTSSLENNRKPGGNWMMLGVIVVATFALILTGLLIALRDRSAAKATPPVVTRPGVPPIHPPP